MKVYSTAYNEKQSFIKGPIFELKNKKFFNEWDTRSPVFKVEKNLIYSTNKRDVNPHYEIKNDMIYRTHFHPDGYTTFPDYQIKGNSKKVFKFSIN